MAEQEEMAKIGPLSVLEKFLFGEIINHLGEDDEARIMAAFLHVTDMATALNLSLPLYTRDVADVRKMLMKYKEAREKATTLAVVKEVIS